MARKNPLSLLQQLRIEDPQIADETGTKRMIVSMLFISLALDLLMIILKINPFPMFMLGVVIFGVLLFAIRGFLTPAKIAIPLGGLALFTFLLFKNNGLRDPAMLGLPLVVIVASLLAGRWGAVVYGILSLMVITLLSLAELSGFIVNRFSEYNLPADYLASGIAVGVVIFLQWLVIGRLNDNIVKARQNENAQKLANDALRLSEAQFRILVEESPDGILIASPQGKIVLVNPSATRILGYDKDELMGTEAMDLIADGTFIPSHDYVEKLMAGQTIETDPVLFKKDGTRIPIMGSNRRMPDGRFQYTFRDISRQKEEQAEREKLISELETKNAELERFTYTVSHDLKSPLVTIRGFLGYIEEDAKSGDLERLNKDVLRITRATEKMQILLHELLELSRIGRITNPPQEVSFEEITREALELVQGHIKERCIKVTLETDSPIVLGDRQRLVEVMQNLLDNAIKFLGNQPEPLIEIGARIQDGQTVFFVSDNGIGIPPEHHERVFGLFNKLDTNVEGTGVGLALVKRIIEVHNGRIWIASDGLGNGTTIYFTLPITQGKNSV